MVKVKSPITKSSNVKLESTFDTKKIIEGYKNIYNINVERFFEGLNSVQIYRCNDSHYKFFYPFNIYGDGTFYEELQKFEWYYIPWKWEHETALKYIKKGKSVLEIGCAKGSFLENLRNSGIFGTGLELNMKATIEGRTKGLTILTETISQHSQGHESAYDVVCSFQVMEHIFDIKQVIEDSLKVLKPGGLFIISVPNNNSFLGKNENYLNMPPHHMGLWNKDSLLQLEKFFNLKLVNIELEPLQYYHKKYFLNTLVKYYLPKESRLLSRIAKKIGPTILPLIRFFLSKEFMAYSVLAVYKKEVK